MALLCQVYLLALFPHHKDLRDKGSAEANVEATEEFVASEGNTAEDEDYSGLHNAWTTCGFNTCSRSHDWQKDIADDVGHVELNVDPSLPIYCGQWLTYCGVAAWCASVTKWQICSPVCELWWKFCQAWVTSWKIGWVLIILTHVGGMQDCAGI
jgi:hypothetical protein